MKLSKALCRLIFGLTFILSGFLKLTDPIGTGLIILEYLAVFHLGFLNAASIGIGIALSAIEFLIGISILLGLRMRFFTWLGLGFISFFTLLTLYLAIFNPITDCGCFGEAIHLTNWETFYKNLVLLTCALVLFFNRKSFIPIAHAAVEWVSVGLFLSVALLIAIPTYYNIPQIDFTAYKIGTDLDKLTRESHAEYETVFFTQRMVSKGSLIFTICPTPPGHLWTQERSWFPGRRNWRKWIYHSGIHPESIVLKYSYKRNP